MGFVCQRIRNRGREIKLRITAQGKFSQPLSKRHLFVDVFLGSLIINLKWGEGLFFEIKKTTEKR